MGEREVRFRTSIDVLICDDVRALRMILRAVIDRTGSQGDVGPPLRVVGEARDGDEAILEAARLQPDVILLDLSMPNRTGLEALPDIKRVALRAKVIVLSSFDESVMASELLAKGADRYLEKGADPRTIADAVAAVVLR